jgi:hypothetical protein
MSRVIELTPRSVELFRTMMAQRCSCSVLADDHQCAGCREYKRLSWELHDELKLKPWEGCPTVIHPDEEPTHPRSSGAGNWQRRRGRQLYRELCKASGIAVGTPIECQF